VLAPEKDGRADAYTDPRRVLARVQGDLERLSAGKEPLKLPEGIKPDALEAFVGAYRMALAGEAGANAALAAVAAEAKKRLEQTVDAAKREGPLNELKNPMEGDIAEYLKRLSALAEAPAEGADGMILRLAATMRLVDAALVLESGSFLYNESYDLFARKDTVYIRDLDLYRDDVYLRLPCRTLPGRRASLEAAAKRLGKAAGPLLSCPVPAAHQLDFDLMERFARDPSGSASAVLPPPLEKTNIEQPAEEPAAPAPPWDRWTAVVFMGENPDAAEKPLEAAAQIDVPGKLDWALFLFAFRPASKARDDKIKKLLAEVEKASRAAAKKSDEEFLLNDESINLRAFDGTDESLLGLLRVASSTGAANTTSAFYGIP